MTPRARAPALLLLVATACVTPAASRLSAAQEEYLRAHPEPRAREAVVNRTVSVGDTMEQVRAAWEGCTFRRQEPATPDVIGGAVAVSKEPIDTWEVFVPIGDLGVTVRNAADEERIPSGRLILTFRDEHLVTWFRLE